jgi:hypothetical protein
MPNLTNKQLALTLNVTSVPDLQGYSLKRSYASADTSVKDSNVVKEVEFLMPVMLIKALREKINEVVGE